MSSMIYICRFCRPVFEENVDLKDKWRRRIHSQYIYTFIVDFVTQKYIRVRYIYFNIRCKKITMDLFGDHSHSIIVLDVHRRI